MKSAVFNEAVAISQDVQAIGQSVVQNHSSAIWIAVAILLFAYSMYDLSLD